MAIAQYIFTHKQHIEQHNRPKQYTKQHNAPSLPGTPWHLPYNWRKSTENPQ